jgi:hypothetical protein
MLEASILAISTDSLSNLSVFTLSALPESLRRLNQNFVSLADFKAWVKK